MESSIVWYCWGCQPPDAELLSLRLRIKDCVPYAFCLQAPIKSDIATRCDGAWQEGAVNAVQEHVHSIRAQGRKLEAHLWWWLCTFNGVCLVEGFLWPAESGNPAHPKGSTKNGAWKNLGLSSGAWEVWTTHYSQYSRTCVRDWFCRPINYPLKKD